MKLLRTYWYIVIILLIIAGIIWYQTAKSATPNGKKIQQITVKRGDIKETLTLSGKIDAVEKTTLRFQTSGRLAWVGIKEGDRVKPYQALASLDVREVQKTLEKTLRDYSNQRNDFDQTVTTTYTGSPTDYNDTIKRILEKNQWDLEKTVLDVELKNLAIEYSTLFTPIEGIITKVDAKNAGINITPATAEIDVINPKTLYLSVTADQGEVTKIREGLIGDLTFDAFPETHYVGSISAISFTPKSDESSTVYEVKVMLTNPSDTTFRVGMTADAVFATKLVKDALAIPSSAISTKNGKSYVQKLVNDKPVETLVTLGDELDNDRIILSGLSEGDIIND